MKEQPCKIGDELANDACGPCKVVDLFHSIYSDSWIVAVIPDGDENPLYYTPDQLGL